MVRKTKKNNRKKFKNKRSRNRTRRRLKKLDMKGGALLDFFNIFKKVEKKADPEKKIDEVNKGFLAVLEGRVKGLFQRQQKQLDETKDNILSQIKTAVNTASKEAKKAVGAGSELTIPFLEKVLTKYFNNDTNKVADLINFIKSNQVSSNKNEKEKNENQQLKNMIDDIKPDKDSEKKEEKKEEGEKEEKKKEGEKEEKNEDDKNKEKDNVDDNTVEDSPISIEEVDLEIEDDSLLKDD